MDSALDFHSLRALLQWQVELGVDEAIGDVPINRYDAPAKAPKVTAPAVATGASVPAAGNEAADAIEAAKRAAEGAEDLDALRAALDAYEHCELKRGARNLV